MRCPVCDVRVGPCVEGDAPIPQYHAALVRAEAAVRVDYATEAVRLRTAQKGSGR